MSSPSFMPQLEQPELKAQASNASMTQLPPSPELKSSMQQPLMAPGEFSLLATASLGTTDISIPSLTIPTRRLRSVARYQAFHPQALACSDILTSSLNEEETAASSSATTTRSASKDPGPSSLGAVAGAQGVALFRLSRPHIPLLILSHATNTHSNSQRSVSSMAFQPTLTSSTPSAPQSLYLAATRGSGVLIWDASGHSPNPLVGRLGMDQVNGQYGTPTDYEDARIVSVAWKPSTMTPLLGTATSTSLSLWDLRSSAANTVFKPNLRFGTARRVLETHVPLVQTAFSSESNECATMDSSGVVRVYDIRMADRARSYMGSPVSTFAAHDTAGVGIAYFPGSSRGSSSATNKDSTNSRWLTWGLDSPFSWTVAKVWSKDENKQTLNTSTNSDVDEYWTMSDNFSQGQQSKTSSTQPEYSLTAQCVRPNLACARVGASPVENSFVAIGHIASNIGAPENRGWWAELYTINTQHDNEEEPPKRKSVSSTYGMKKVAGFQGGTSKNSGDKNELMSVLGSRVGLGNLTAAELGFSGSQAQPQSQHLADALADKKDDEVNQVELLLCCMSDTGVVTTHVSTKIHGSGQEHLEAF
jgi:hypothetical protein